MGWRGREATGLRLLTPEMNDPLGFGLTPATSPGMDTLNFTTFIQQACASHQGLRDLLHETLRSPSTRHIIALTGDCESRTLLIDVLTMSVDRLLLVPEVSLLPLMRGARISVYEGPAYDGIERFMGETGALITSTEYAPASARGEVIEMLPAPKYAPGDDIRAEFYAWLFQRPQLLNTSDLGV